MLSDFMEYLTQEQDNLVQMGTIKYTKYQSLFDGVSNQSKGKNKVLSQRKKEERHSSTERSSYTDGSSRSRRRKNKKERPTCGYCIGSHL